MRNEFDRVSNGQLLEIAEEKSHLLYCYVEGLIAGQSEDGGKVELYDGTIAYIGDEIDFSKPNVRRIFEKSDLLICRALFETANNRDIADKVADIWGVEATAVVLSVELHGTANKNSRPFIL